MNVDPETGACSRTDFTSACDRMALSYHCIINYLVVVVSLPADTYRLAEPDLRCYADGGINNESKMDGMAFS